MKKPVIIIIVISLLLRLVLSAVTFHYDVRAFDFGRYLIQQGHLTDFYDYLGRLPVDDPILKQYPADFFIYPPLIYAYQAIWGMPVSGLLTADFQHNFLFEVGTAMTNSQIYWHLVWLKLPYFGFDLLAAWALSKLFSRKQERLWAFGLWMFNPVSLYASCMLGQFDVIPTALVIVSAVLASQKKWYWAAFALGIGASFKIYPLFLVIPLATMVPGLMKRLKIGVVAGLGYILPVAPFLGSHGFRSSALVAGQTLKSLYAQVPISGGESIILFLGILILWYWAFWHAKNSWSLSLKYLAVLTTFFSLTHFHPQWFLWITPWILVVLIKQGFRYWLVVSVILAAYIAEIMLFEPGLNIGLFAPLNPSLLTAGSWWQAMGWDLNLMRSLAQTVLVASLIWLVYDSSRHVNETASS